MQTTIIYHFVCILFIILMSYQFCMIRLGRMYDCIIVILTRACTLVSMLSHQVNLRMIKAEKIFEYLFLNLSEV